MKRERNGPDPSGVREAVGTFFSTLHSSLFTLDFSSVLLFFTSVLPS